MNEKNFSVLIRDFFGILVIAFTLFSLFSMTTYSPNDPSLHNAVSEKSKVLNLGGMVGAYISDSLVQMFGTGAFFFPVLTFIMGWALIRGQKFEHWPWVLSSAVLCLVSLCALGAVLLETDPFFGKKVVTGGLTGSVLGSFLVRWVNQGGAVLILGTFLFVSILGMTRLSANALIDHLQSSIFGMIRWTLEAGPALKESFVNWREKVEAERLEMEQEELVNEPIIVTPSQPMILQPVEKNNRRKSKPVEEEEDKEEFYVDDEELLADAAEGEYQIPPLSLLED